MMTLNSVPDWLNCPATLTGEAAAEWGRIAPRLLEMLGNDLVTVDIASLEFYCQAFEFWYKARQRIAVGDNSPAAIREAAELRQDALNWLAEFTGVIWANDYLRGEEVD
jgi:phage terminase small subunit